jgi:hypothetical protein
MQMVYLQYMNNNNFIPKSTGVLDSATLPTISWHAHYQLTTNSACRETTRKQRELVDRITEILTNRCMKGLQSSWMGSPL